MMPSRLYPPYKAPDTENGLRGLYMAKVLRVLPDTGRVLCELHDGSQLIEAFVVSPHANAASGWCWLPQVDDLVVVAFLQGHKSLPVVMGALHDKDDTPPTTAPDEFRLRHQSGTVLTVAADGDVSLVHPGGPTLSIQSSRVQVTAEGATVEIQPTGDIQLTHPNGADLRIDETKISLNNGGSIIEVDADGALRMQYGSGNRIRVESSSIVIQDGAGNNVTLSGGNVSVAVSGDIELGGVTSVALAGEMTGPQVGSGGSHTHQIVGTSLKLKGG